MPLFHLGHFLVFPSLVFFFLGGGVILSPHFWSYQRIQVLSHIGPVTTVASLVVVHMDTRVWVDASDLATICVVMVPGVAV